MVTVGLLVAAMPFGMVVGAFVLAKMATPSTRMRMMGGWPSCPASR
jgi:F0F1-type ATP synthase membrane subunit c/vacuolar-type H+-ATPase subunit K